MAALPDYVIVLLDGYSEQFDPGVASSEMERGLSKLRVAQSRVVVGVSAALVFETAADATAFETWYFTDIRRIGWFDWLDPRTSVLRTVRFRGGDIGALEALAPGVELSRRRVTLEYLR